MDRSKGRVRAFLQLAIIVALVGVFLNSNARAKAADTREEESDEVWDMLDTAEIQEVLDDLRLGDGFRFDDYVKELSSGEGNVSFEGLVQDAFGTVGNELRNNAGTVVRILLIAVIAAVFTNFSNVFQGKQISETGFYITYMLMFAILTVSFLSVTMVAQKALEDLQEFMKALLPSYFVAVAYTTGVNTSTVFYQATMFIVVLVDALLIRIVMPGIRIYFVLSLSNYLMREDRFSRLANLLGKMISWGLKSLLGVVIGFQTIQGLIVPVADSVKRSALTKAVGSIPGIGNMFGSAAETVIGAGLLVKNAIGVAGLLVVVTICAVPLIKLTMYMLVYQFSAAIVQPISDKRILSCIGATADSAKLLLFTVFIGAVMFLFSITIITVMTGRVT